MAKSSDEDDEEEPLDEDEMELIIPEWPFNFLILSPVSTSNTPACFFTWPRSVSVSKSTNVQNVQSCQLMP